MAISQTKQSQFRVTEANAKSVAGRRRYHRSPANWPAHCFVEGVLDCSTVIVDASEGGFGLSTSLAVPVGTTIIISIAQVGVFPCRLAWKNDKRCGVEMLREDGYLSDTQMASLGSVLTDE
ncbi:MAG: PilZ domain-containing protein [Hyphomicrobiaceae bacterium]